VCKCGDVCLISFTVSCFFNPSYGIQCIHIYICINMHINIHIHVLVHVYIYIYIYIYIHTHRGASTGCPPTHERQIGRVTRRVALLSSLGARFEYSKGTFNPPFVVIHTGHFMYL